MHICYNKFTGFGEGVALQLSCSCWPHTQLMIFQLWHRTCSPEPPSLSFSHAFAPAAGSAASHLSWARGLEPEKLNLTPSQTSRNQPRAEQGTCVTELTLKGKSTFQPEQLIRTYSTFFTGFSRNSLSTCRFSCWKSKIWTKNKFQSCSVKQRVTNLVLSLLSEELKKPLHYFSCYSTWFLNKEHHKTPSFLFRGCVVLQVLLLVGINTLFLIRKERGQWQKFVVGSCCLVLLRPQELIDTTIINLFIYSISVPSRYAWSQWRCWKFWGRKKCIRRHQ